MHVVDVCLYGGAQVVVAVGEQESDEFKRQSADFAAQLRYAIRARRSLV